MYICKQEVLWHRCEHARWEDFLMRNVILRFHDKEGKIYENLN